MRRVTVKPRLQGCRSKFVPQARDPLAEVETPLYEGRATVLEGRLAAEDDDVPTARTHWEDALSTFESIGGKPDVLDRRRRLTLLATDEADGDRVCPWGERARKTLDSAPEQLAELHREWVERHGTGPDERDEQAGT